MDSISLSSDKENASEMNYAHQQQETGGVKIIRIGNDDEQSYYSKVKAELIKRLRKYCCERYPKESWDEEKIFKTIGMSCDEFMKYLETTMGDDMDWVLFLLGKYDSQSFISFMIYDCLVLIMNCTNNCIIYRYTSY